MTTPTITGFAQARDAIPTVGTTALRDARWPAPPTGFKVFNVETEAFERYTGSAWVLLRSLETVPAADFTGVDWGAKVQAALASLAVDQILDARVGFSGLLAMASDLTVSGNGVTTLLPQAELFTAQRIVVTGQSVRLQSPRGWGTGVGSSFFYRYTGATGAAIDVGSATADTEGFELVGGEINVVSAGAAAYGLRLRRCANFSLRRVRQVQSALNTAMFFDGTGHFTGLGTVQHPWIVDGAIGMRFGGSGVNAANAIVVTGGLISGGGGASIGVKMDSGVSSNGNRFVGTDLENWGTAVQDNYGDNSYECRHENNTLDYDFTNAVVQARVSTPDAITIVQGAIPQQVQSKSTWQIGGASGGNVRHNVDANGGYWTDGVSAEVITLSTGAATTDSASNLLPQDALIDAVTYRVRTGIGTAASFSIGDPTTAARFVSGAVGLTAGSTGVGLLHMAGNVTTVAAGPTQSAAAKLRITCNATPSAGVILVYVHWRVYTAPSV